MPPPRSTFSTCGTTLCPERRPRMSSSWPTATEGCLSLSWWVFYVFRSSCLPSAPFHAAERHSAFMALPSLKPSRANILRTRVWNFGAYNLACTRSHTERSSTWWHWVYWCLLGKEKKMHLVLMKVFSVCKQSATSLSVGTHPPRRKWRDERAICCGPCQTVDGINGAHGRLKIKV